MWALLALGCGAGAGPTAVSGGAGGTTVSGGSGGGGGGAAGTGADVLVWRTDAFNVDPGQERYICFASPLDEALTVDSYSTAGLPFVHHIIFARTRTAAPNGFSECGSTFQTSWDPLFIAGAGASTLQFPSDAGHVLTKGTQLLVQLHLLNLGADPVTGTLAISMHRSSVVNPRPVNSYVFGTMNVHLPPMQESQVVGQCDVRERVNLIAAFPHMHTLGRAMRFEVGKSLDALTPKFVRDPFNFNDQRMETVAIDLAQGDKVRLTCTYQNPNPTEVTYGESTLNEMCYLIGFAIDRSSMGGCVQ